MTQEEKQKQDYEIAQGRSIRDMEWAKKVQEIDRIKSEEQNRRNLEAKPI